jgi:hypothetical protein
VVEDMVMVFILAGMGVGLKMLSEDRIVEK